MFQAKISSPGGSGLSGSYPQAQTASAVPLPRLLAAARRQAPAVLGCIFAGFVAGIVYLLTAVPLYTAAANVMIDPRQLRLAPREAPAGSDPASPDNTIIESQVEVFRSERVGLAVVGKLDLTSDPAFAPSSGKGLRAIWAAVTGLIGGTASRSANPEDAQKTISAEQLAALEELNRNLKVTRVGRTAVLEVAYTSRDPVRAAQIANEIVEAFMRDQLDARVEAARGAADWLKRDTEEVRQLAAKADVAAQKFRGQHNLVATKGLLISEQQLNETSAQLVSDRAATAQAKARYLRLKEIIESHQTDAAVSESLSNQVINDLRTKYLDYSKRMKELERKLGPDHVAVTNLKNMMGEVSTLLFQELGRIAESYRNDYEVAAAREKATAESLQRQQSIAIATNDAQVQLRQLEEEADSYRTIYQNDLKAYRELTQQESFPITEARLIARAMAPISPSHPHKGLTLAISLALGALAGAGIGTAREAMDRVFRTAGQIRDELGIAPLGLLPLIRARARAGQQKAPSVWRYALDEPFSAFAETLRSAKIAADEALRGRAPKVISFVSLLPKEGKSTIAMNFASLLAAQGLRALLVDADMRNPALTRALGYKPKQSSRGQLSIPPLESLLYTDPGSGLQILPCFYTRDDPRAAEGLPAETFDLLLKSSSVLFDYVIIDLPPIGPVVNARALAPAIDAFILVIEWGSTSRGAVRSLLAKEEAIAHKLLGAVLNKADLERLPAYEDFDSDGYYLKQYQSYYHSDR